MRSSRLADAFSQRLVAPTQQLAPQRARAQSVAMPKALPQQIRYGSIPPGIAQSSRFTGGVVQRQPVQQLEPPPDFRQPYYEALGLTVPRAVSAPTPAPSPLGSRLGALLSGGTSTGATFGALPPPTGGLPASAPTQTVAPIYAGSNTGTSGELPQRLNPAYVSDVTRLTRAAQFGTKLPGGYYQQ